MIMIICSRNHSRYNFINWLNPGRSMQFHASITWSIKNYAQEFVLGSLEPIQICMRGCSPHRRGIQGDSE